MPIYAGTDAGGYLPHGLVGAEIAELARFTSPDYALGAGSWRARQWLGRPDTLVEGAPVPDPETVASAIRIGNPASWDLAMQAADSSGGKFRAASDTEILAAQSELASRDGVFVEPASAAGIAGLLLEAREGVRYAGQRVVVTVTGHGLKDIDTALSSFTDLVDTVCDPDVEAAAAAAGLG